MTQREYLKHTDIQTQETFVHAEWYNCHSKLWRHRGHLRAEVKGAEICKSWAEKPENCNCFSWWPEHGAVITDSQESQQCPNTSPHSCF